MAQAHSTAGVKQPEHKSHGTDRNPRNKVFRKKKEDTKRGEDLSFSEDNSVGSSNKEILKQAITKSERKNAFYDKSLNNL